eukprot:gene9597-11287_t
MAQRWLGLGHALVVGHSQQALSLLNGVPQSLTLFKAGSPAASPDAHAPAAYAAAHTRPWLISEPTGPVTFHQASLPSESGLLPAIALTACWPGINPLGQHQASALSLDDACAQTHGFALCGVEPERNPHLGTVLFVRGYPAAHSAIRQQHEELSCAHAELQARLSAQQHANFTATDVTAVVGSSIWTCGRAPSTICAVANVESGALNSEYAFPWEATVSAHSDPSFTSVTFGANSARSGVAYSEIAFCSRSDSLLCSVMEFTDTTFVASVSLPSVKQIVYIGQYNSLPLVTLAAVSSSSQASDVRSYVYTPSAVRSVKLTHLTSVLNFAGVFLAGTGTVVTNGATVPVVVAGWVSSSSGVLSAMYIVPVGSTITTDEDLVNVIAMVRTGPDSLIGGGIKLSSVGAVTTAYLVRINTLYKTALFGVVFVSETDSPTHSAVKGLVSESKVAYLLLNCERAVSRTSATSRRGFATGRTAGGSAGHHILATAQPEIARMITVLKVNSTTGEVLQQTSLSVSNANVSCSDITASALSLILTCAVQNDLISSPSVILLATNRDLSFQRLPVGWSRNITISVTAVATPFQATSFAAPAASKVIPTSSFTYSTAGQTPTWRPTIAPTIALSSRPTKLRPPMLSR